GSSLFHRPRLRRDDEGRRCELPKLHHTVRGSRREQALFYPTNRSDLTFMTNWPRETTALKREDESLGGLRDRNPRRKHTYKPKGAVPVCVDLEARANLLAPSDSRHARMRAVRNGIRIQRDDGHLISAMEGGRDVARVGVSKKFSTTIDHSQQREAI